MKRDALDVDIACVGFGPATMGFLTTLTNSMTDDSGMPRHQSQVAEGMPLQVACYERNAELGAGVSGVVTRARSMRESLPDFDPSQVPMATPVHDERLIYLLDPIGASRRSRTIRTLDRALSAASRFGLKVDDHAVALPVIPEFLRKDGGWVLSLGQFNQWLSMQIMGSGLVQLWPGSPVAQPLIEDSQVTGVRLCDQGTDRKGTITEQTQPGMDIRARLTVLGDGPYGPVSTVLDETLGTPQQHHRRDWALGMKFVIELPAEADLQPGTVIHTFGFPEPEIFGFVYVHPDRLVSVGIFVPSWFGNPVRTAYRYLQHYITHPFMSRMLHGGTLISWGAKSLLESGLHAEPHLVTDGCARIGEGSGTTNVLSGSGVDEAWQSGVMLAEAVLNLLDQGKPFTKDNLESTYVTKRRLNWLQQEAITAKRSRDGFQRGILPGLFNMALSAWSGGRWSVGKSPPPTWQSVQSPETFFAGKLPAEQIKALREQDADADQWMDACGWPAIAHDGKMLVSHQDAMLLGGKVQAPDGYADHVIFRKPELCRTCQCRVCVTMCSGQAISADPEHGVTFDHEKCIHCGACIWNCSRSSDGNETSNVQFLAGAGGLNSTQN